MIGAAFAVNASPLTKRSIGRFLYPLEAFGSQQYVHQ
jgi:hypothetical protein